MDPDAWDVFHDGEIASVSGCVPGDLEFTIEADYLREQFPEPGVAFTIRVTECDMISFKEFRTNSVVHGLGALVGHDLEMHDARLDGDVLVVTTADGALRIRYQSETLALDSGRVLQVSDVAAAGDRAVAELKAET